MEQPIAPEPQPQPAPEPQAAPPPPEPAAWATQVAPAAPPRKKTWLYVLIGVAALVLVLAIGGLIAIWQLGLLPFLTGGLASPEIMPQNVGFYGTARIDIQTTTGYKHLYDVYSQIPGFQDSIDEALADMTEQSGISFEKDIQPWLGNEIAFGVTNMEAIPGSQMGVLDLMGRERPEPGYIVAVATRDTNASEALLAKIRGQFEEQGYTVERKEIGGVPFYVRQARSKYDTAMVLGTFKGFVIVATDEETVQGVVDAGQGRAESLAKSRQYQEIMAALPSNAAAYFVLTDMQALLEASEESGGLLSTGLTAPGQIAAYKSAGGAVLLGTEGVEVDIVVTFDPTALSEETLAGMQGARGQDRMVERVPADALAFVSGNDLASSWKNFVTTLRSNTELGLPVDEIDDALGMPLEELLAWASDEYVLAVVETAGPIPDFPIGAFALLEVSDRAQAERATGKVADLLGQAAGTTFEPGDIGGVEMQLLRDPYSGQTFLGYGFDREGHLLIGFAEGAMEDGLGQGSEPISQDAYFRRVQEHLPKGGGYSYVNIERIWKLVYDTMPSYSQQEFDESTRPYLEPIKAAGWAGHPIDTGRGIAKATLFIYIP